MITQADWQLISSGPVCDRRSVLAGAFAFGGIMMTGCSTESRNVDFAIEKHVGAKDRPAIIFVHSDAGNKEQFASALEHVRAAGWSVASFDRRGHGQSSMPRDGKFGYAFESQDVFAVADEVGFERIIVVGHSGGGDVAFKAVNERPQRVAGMLLVDPSPDPAIFPDQQTAQTLEGLRKDFKAAIGGYYRSMAGPDGTIADRIVATAQATPPATIIGITEHLMDFRPHEYAGKFTGHANSIIQPQFDIEGALHRIQPGMSHEAIGGAGHWIHIGARQKFEAALDRFLARVT